LGHGEPAAEARIKVCNGGRKPPSDTEALDAPRMAKSAAEMGHWPEYDYVIVNSDIEDSVGLVQAIVTAERLPRTRQVGLADFVNRLRAG
jgi:guanylate kinase